MLNRLVNLNKNAWLLIVTVAALLSALAMVALGRISTSGMDSVIPVANQSIAASADVSPFPVIDLSRGSPSAPVVVMLCTDFQCEHCQQFALTLEPQIEQLYIATGKVYWRYKFTTGFGTESRRANLAAACAAEQGQFWQYYYLLMQQHASPRINDLPLKKLQDLAQQLGLDMDKFNDSFMSNKFADWVDRDNAEIRALGVNETPTFFINGTRKAGAKDLPELQAIIDPLLESSSKAK